ncbi:MAG: ATP-binding cassette domain-containing protein [Candidatus Aminicenantes bacterium]|nr:ATP-binding cassette domain-containing protein [Candidatus Aminicenantes bacterium]
MALEVKNLSLYYKQKWVLRNFSLSCARGKITAVTGQSGVGKTTLLKCILGFTQPGSGDIFLDGEKLTLKTVWDFRQRIGYVQQEPVLGTGIVRDILRQPFLFKANRHLQWKNRQVEDLFESFLLEPDLLTKRVPTLSGGEKQRIALISALMLEREFYLFDEITSALDELTERAVLHYIEGRKDLSILAVTHDKQFLLISDSVFHMENSKERKNA